MELFLDVLFAVFLSAWMVLGLLVLFYYFYDISSGWRYERRMKKAQKKEEKAKRKEAKKAQEKFISNYFPVPGCLFMSSNYEPSIEELDIGPSNFDAILLGRPFLLMKKEEAQNVRPMSKLLLVERDPFLAERTGRCLFVKVWGTYEVDCFPHYVFIHIKKEEL